MTAQQPTDDAALQRHMVSGSAWIISVRWSLRLLGLISTIVLARLLTPADYGIVAIASMIVGLVEIFSRAGLGSAVIRHPNPTREHYDTAWTVNLLIGIVLACIVWALAPLTTAYFHEPRAKLIVEILAFRMLLYNAQNIGIANFQRELQFRKQFWLNVIPSLVSFPITIVLAFLWRNYWALVVSLMVEYAVSLVLSYAMEPFRPRVCFSKIREIGSFSVWSLLKNIAMYLNTQVDRLVIGGFAGTSAMGRYQVAADVATMPSQEVANPIVAAFFPVLARVQHDREKRCRLYLMVLYWSALVCTSTAVGVALVTDDFVDLVLGDKWVDVKPLMPWLALSFGVLGMTNSVYTALDTIGRPIMSARLQWLRLFGLALTIIPVAYLTRDMVALAMTRLIVTIVITPTLFLALGRAFGFSAGDIVMTLWRPIVAALVMAAVVLSVNAAISFSGPPRLFIDVVMGATAYVGAIMALWLVVGRPEGPELVVWNRLALLRRRPNQADAQ